MAGLKDVSIVVTGGAGFIGGHLVAKLLSLGAKVVVVDICINPKSTFIAEKVYKDTILELVDIRDKKEILRVFQDYKPSFIFHLAAEPIVDTAFENPYSTFDTNIMGTVNVLEAAKKVASAKKIIIASSDKAYGKTKEAYTESSPLRGDHPYDVSKSSADLISYAYFKTYGLPVIITRFGNVYGEGDLHFNRIVPGICEALIKNQTLNIRSNGKYVRDYLYVEDVVDGYILLALTTEKILGEAFNFSSKDSLSVLELIKQVELILGKRVKYVIKNNAKNEIPYQHLNDDKISKLGWKNKHNMKSTLLTILEWYNKAL